MLFLLLSYHPSTGQLAASLPTTQGIPANPKGSLGVLCRTFRGRKELYARTLEKELDRIRVSEAQLMKQCARLQDEVENLTECLARYGIASPSREEGPGRPGPHNPGSLPSTAATEVPLSRDRSATHTGHGGAVVGGGSDPRVAKKPAYQPFPGPDLGQHQDYPHHQPPEDHSPSVCFSTSPESQGNSLTYSTPQRGSLWVSDLDPSIVGMEFVLM